MRFITGAAQSIQNIDIYNKNQVIWVSLNVKERVGKNCLKKIAAIICFAVFLPDVFAGPITLPDAARPGAVRPEGEERSQIPQAELGDVFEIPEVIERPFEIDEGERIIVQHFELINVIDLPKFEVSVAEIETLIEENKKARTDGYSIGRLQELADEVTKYYRSKGLILAQAVIPVQDVTDGVVKLQVFEGRLGRVLAEGNELYSEKILKQVFKGLIGQPITKQEIEAALLTLTDYPGLTVYGVFQPGQLVGTADMVLNVQEEKRYDFALRGDNHGVQETGVMRGRLSVDFNNITRGADRLNLLVQQTYNQKASLFQSVEYTRFLPYGFKLGTFWNRNDFKVTAVEFDSQGITAESENVGFYAAKSFVRSRRENLSAELGLTRKFSETKGNGVKRNRDILGVVHASLEYDSVDTNNWLPFLEFFQPKSEEGQATFQTGGINFAQLEFSKGIDNFLGSMGSAADNSLLPTGVQPSRQGRLSDGTLIPASGSFVKLFGSFSRLQTIVPNHSILFRSEMQWTPDLLVPVEQYSIGGAENVRAFSPAHKLVDRAMFFSFEYIINAPFIASKPAFANRTWGELLQFSMFYDLAVGNLNDPLVQDEQTWENYKGAGFGFRFNVPGSVAARLMWAWAIGAPTDADTGQADNGNDRRPQFWGDVTYSF